MSVKRWTVVGGIVVSCIVSAVCMPEILKRIVGITAHAQQVPVKVITFDDLKPSNINKDLRTWQGQGRDPQGQIYTTLCNDSNPGDCYVFRYTPNTGQRVYLGSSRAASSNEGNLKNEKIVKGHTHLRYMDGKMWYATMGAHDARNTSILRGVHIYSYDLATGKIEDHAVNASNGIFLPKQVTYAMNVIPEKNTIVVLGMPGCNIVLYNHLTKQTKTVKGLPNPGSDAGNTSGRDIGVLADGDILYQCRKASTNLGLYNHQTEQNRDTGQSLQSPLWNGAAYTSDGNIAYLTDFHKIFKFDTRNDSLTTVTNLHNGAEVWSLNMSLDEKKLYYVVNIHPNSGPKNSIRNDLYEYNLETGVRTKLVDLKPHIGTSAQVSGSHVISDDGKIYFVFYSRTKQTSGLIEVDVSDRTGPAPGGSSSSSNSSGSTSSTGGGSTSSGSTSGGSTGSGSTSGGAISCVNSFLSGSQPLTGFAPAWNVVSAGHELLLQVASCIGADATVSVGTPTQNIYTYENGFYWNGVTWEQFTLAPGASSQKIGVWIQGQGTGTFTRTLKTNYYVGYTCQWIAGGTAGSGEWKCGCVDVTCAQPAWQLQGIQ